MPTRLPAPLAILIDELTNSVRDTTSDESLATTVLPLAAADLATIRKKLGWQFAWATEFRQADRTIYKLVINALPTEIQGLLSISNRGDHYYVHLVESAPANLGRQKRYSGVPANLFAFACKLSWDMGQQGIVSFQAKTRLLTHYETMLGAEHVGGHTMIIYPLAALRLIRRYFVNS